MRPVENPHGRHLRRGQRNVVINVNAINVVVFGGAAGGAVIINIIIASSRQGGVAEPGVEQGHIKLNDITSGGLAEIVKEVVGYKREIIIRGVGITEIGVVGIIGVVGFGVGVVRVYANDVC